MIRQKLQHGVLALMMILGIVSVVPVSDVGAINVVNRACNGRNANTTICNNREDDINQLIQRIIRIMLVVLGSIAVIMIIVGGFRYVVSDGDANKIKQAKDTILYSLVGLIVALLSYAIVEFVVSYF